MIEEFHRLGLFDLVSAPVTENFAAWSPCNLTLFLTWDCNLRCVYCYSSGGESPCDMPEEIAQAAIRTAADGAAATALKRFSVTYHGGGEPTLNWALFTRTVEYARNVASERLLPPLALRR